MATQQLGVTRLNNFTAVCTRGTSVPWSPDWTFYSYTQQLSRNAGVNNLNFGEVNNLAFSKNGKVNNFWSPWFRSSQQLLHAEISRTQQFLRSEFFESQQLNSTTFSRRIHDTQQHNSTTSSCWLCGSCWVHQNFSQHNFFSVNIFLVNIFPRLNNSVNNCPWQKRVNIFSLFEKGPYSRTG